MRARLTGVLLLMMMASEGRTLPKSASSTKDRFPLSMRTVNSSGMFNIFESQMRHDSKKNTSDESERAKLTGKQESMKLRWHELLKMRLLKMLGAPLKTESGESSSKSVSRYMMYLYSLIQSGAFKFQRDDLDSHLNLEPTIRAMQASHISVKRSTATFTFTFNRQAGENVRHVQLVLQIPNKRSRSFPKSTSFPLKITVTHLPRQGNAGVLNNTFSVYPQNIHDKDHRAVYHVLDVSESLLSETWLLYDRIKVDVSAGSEHWLQKLSLQRHLRKRESAYKPVLVFYSNFVVPTQIPQQPAAANVTVNFNVSSSLPSREKRSKMSNNPHRNNELPRGNAHHDKVCRLHGWRVDFEELGWDSFMVAPKGFEANFCDGSCSIDDSSAMWTVAISNHAFLRGLYRATVGGFSHEDTIPKPCCVPLRYGAVSLLYMDKQGHFVVKHVKQLTAESCACL